MSEFQAVLVEGWFFEKDGHLFIEKDNGEVVAWSDVLRPLDGHRIQFALHHLPPHGVQVAQPGAGSCRFPNGVGCPVRHDLFPGRLLAFHLEGVLRSDPWRMVKFDGTIVAIPIKGMVGHYGRVAGATIVDVEAMRETLAKQGLSAVLPAGMGAQEVEAMLDRLRRSTEN